MKEDGSRLSISISVEGDAFSIVDVFTSESIIYKKGNFVVKTLDCSKVVTQLQNLQEALLSFKPALTFGLKPFGNDDTISIRTNEHFDWTINYKSSVARIKNNMVKHSTLFDSNYVLKYLNKVYSVLLTANTVLDPKRNIIRKISDIGAVIWKYEGHSILTYEQYVASDYITNCLVDGIFYDQVFVAVSKEAGTVKILDKKDLTELFEAPIDESVLLFHKETTDIFNMEE